MKKRVICVLLAFVMCCSLVGCKGQETRHQEKFTKISEELTECCGEFADVMLSMALDFNKTDKDYKSYEKKLEKIYDEAEDLVKDLKRCNDRYGDDLFLGDTIVSACESSLEEIGKQLEEFRDNH